VIANLIAERMNALIVDDEELGRRALAGMIGEYCPEIESVSIVASAAEARDAIVRFGPDILFLDIEMPGENGFDLLESIHPSHRLFSIVFVTAYDHYALRAIESSALDFLLKPVDIDRLRESVRRASARPPATQIANSPPIESSACRRTTTTRLSCSTMENTC
jgi:two-component system, LytTR family, response regulator